VVAAQLVVAERVLHDPPVVQVLLGVEQHQPAREERADEPPPGRAAGEDLVAVDEELLERLRPADHVHVDAEGPHRVDLAVLLPQVRRVLDRLLAQLEQVHQAEPGPGGLAQGDVRGRGHRLPPGH
jgi:hypothetical protein